MKNALVNIVRYFLKNSLCKTYENVTLLHSCDPDGKWRNFKGCCIERICCSKISGFSHQDYMNYRFSMNYFCWWRNKTKELPCNWILLRLCYILLCIKLVSEKWSAVCSPICESINLVALISVQGYVAADHASVGLDGCQGPQLEWTYKLQGKKPFRSWGIAIVQCCKRSVNKEKTNQNCYSSIYID